MLNYNNRPTISGGGGGGGAYTPLDPTVHHQQPVWKRMMMTLPAWWNSLSGKHKMLIGLAAVFVLWAMSVTGGKENSSSKTPFRTVKVATWNVGAINNNPFEYWLTMDDDPNYASLLEKVEAFVQTPPIKKDVEVSMIFTQQMYDTLRQEMSKLKWDGLTDLDRLWSTYWSKRKVVSEFLKDPSIGLKRLVSMPDRMTNTITTQQQHTVFRPTAVNCYAAHISSIADWYEKWLTFMFHTVVKNGKTPAETLERIPRAKYPALTEEEERISVPLQTLVIAIFDAIQVRMLNQLAGQETWQKLRQRICQELNTKKTANTLGVIRNSYGDVDVFMLQETAAAFVDEAQAALQDVFYVVKPGKLGKNDQNSLILLRKTTFPRGGGEDVREILVKVPVSGMVSDGDLFMIEVKDAWHRSFTIASFHGDTNGLATVPVVTAVMQNVKPSSRLLFGLDANTYFKKAPGEVQDVEGFMEAFTALELTSVWGTSSSPAPPHTTKNARTYMQPQLSKAASRGEIETKGDMNPKDFILFSPSRFIMVGNAPVRDNTGKKTFEDDLVFPTLVFPSDHAILSAELTVI